MLLWETFLVISKPWIAFNYQSIEKYFFASSSLLKIKPVLFSENEKENLQLYCKRNLKKDDFFHIADIIFQDMKITFIGAGAWNSALSIVLADNHHDITLYSISKEQEEEINRFHTNRKYLGELPLSPKAVCTTDIRKAMSEAQVVVLGVPSNCIRSAIEDFLPYLKTNPILVNVAKGFDPVTFEGITSMIEKLVPEDKIKGVVSLMGPSFAKEVAKRESTAICAVGHHIELNKEIQQLFSNEYFRVYTQDDVVGAEVGAGMKNIIAIASGILTGLGYENNSRAALITRGLAEITRFGVSKGAKEKTFLGLTGIGDLFLTCSSTTSRNFSAGLQIGKADSSKEFIRTNHITVEGIEATRLIYQEAKKNGISVPITESVYKILFEDKKPSEVVKQLMNRSLKAE